MQLAKPGLHKERVMLRGKSVQNASAFILITASTWPEYGCLKDPITAQLQQKVPHSKFGRQMGACPMFAGIRVWKELSVFPQWNQNGDFLESEYSLAFLD